MLPRLPLIATYFVSNMSISKELYHCSTRLWSVHASVSQGQCLVKAIGNLLLSEFERCADKRRGSPNARCGVVIAGSRVLRIVASESDSDVTRKINMWSDDFDVYRLRTWTRWKHATKHRYFEYEVGMSEFDLLVETREDAEGETSAYATLCLPVELCSHFCEVLQSLETPGIAERRNRFLERLQRSILFQTEIRNGQQIH